MQKTIEIRFTADIQGNNACLSRPEQCAGLASRTAGKPIQFAGRRSARAERIRARRPRPHSLTPTTRLAGSRATVPL